MNSDNNSFLRNINLNNLEYGVDFYGLPTNHVVFIKTKSEIMNKILENKIYGDFNIKNPIYHWTKG